VSEAPSPESAAPSPPRLAPGTRLAGRYRVERLVGSGGMATVWRAVDEVLGRPVAIKVMSDALSADPAYVRRFAGEARTAARISHPNLVQIYDYSALASQPFLVMEYIDGGTLAERARRRPLRADELRQLARELLSAIARVHGAGVLHRDIKPANVLLGSDGRARLTDFGIARLEDSTRLTQPGQVVGTLRYLAPELVQGAPPSKRSDLYALGVLLREIAPENLEDRRLLAVIEQLSAPTAEQRPADAEEVLRRLEAEREPPAVTATLMAPTRPADVAPPRPADVPPTRPADVAPTRPAGLPFRVHATRSWRRLAAAGGALVLVVLVLALTAGGGSSAGHRSPAAGAAHAGATSRTRAGRAIRDVSEQRSGPTRLQQRLTQLTEDVQAAAR
jgi:predicted Ser/Thr protein kinase